MNENSPISREITFTLSGDEFAPFREKRYREAQKKASLKGFRKGKAPLSLIKKLYGNSINEHAAEEAVNETFQKYAETNELQPVGVPHVHGLAHTDDGGLRFVIHYEIMPEFELGEYKGLSTRKVYHIVTPEEIDAEIDWLRQRHRKEETVDTVTDENHKLMADFQRIDESGAPLIGQVSNDVPVNLSSDKINPELKNALIGRKLDEKIRIELPTGENEERIPYEITIKDVTSIELPEVNDEFAAKVTGDEQDTVEDLRDNIKQSLEAGYETRYSRFAREELISKLIDNHAFQVPSALVAQVIGRFLEDEKNNYQDRKLPADFDYNAYYREHGESAERTARWLLIRDKIIEAEGLTVSDEDYEALTQIDAQRLGIEPEALLSYYKGNEDIQQRILAEKVLQILHDYAVVEEEIEDLELEKKLAAEAGEGIEAEGSGNTEASAEETSAEGTTDAGSADEVSIETADESVAENDAK